MKPDRELGIKLTPQRLAVIEYLKGNKDHPSAADIYKAVSERFPTMSFATVYNTLEKLKEKDAVIELSIDPDKKRFDPLTSPHHHLMCVRCKTIKDVFETFSLSLPANKQHDFVIVGNRVDFFGICPQCKNTEKQKLR